MTDTQPQQVATTFVSLADALVADFDVLDFLAQLTERAVDLLAVDAASVILADGRGGRRPAAGSSERPELVELFAAQARQGPSAACVRVGTVVTSPELAADADRWPEFTDLAGRAGFRAAYAIPMRLRDDTIGALTLLSSTNGELTGDRQALGQGLADLATIGILQQRAISREEIIYEQLQATLHRRTVIEQAKGVLAESGDLEMHAAYLVLRGYARASGRRMSDVARDLTTRTLNVDEVLGGRPHAAGADEPGQEGVRRDRPGS
ncbi:transcriptional regulator [Actinocatenispora thailandica]|uniref:Transcriptional regulator n=1 Tax=Actinocatenispora thailandica TaxID=227318 RepID=A0A7R7DWP4_9ACTN|nr:GAF and ANTAR domain-containing protein [Actinocatenispora thailandica]BCJ39280.1 transcriptional regulator [Actinocatenispora thailandica]